jgi:hypothetical protein
LAREQTDIRVGSQAERLAVSISVRITPRKQTSSCVPAVPKSATPTSALLRRSKEQLLFDHLVGAGEQRGWHIEAERLGGLEVDDQIESDRQFDRQVGGCGAL